MDCGADADAIIHLQTTLIIDLACVYQGRLTPMLDHTILRSAAQPLLMNADAYDSQTEISVDLGILLDPQALHAKVIKLFNTTNT